MKLKYQIGSWASDSPPEFWLTAYERVACSERVYDVSGMTTNFLLPPIDTSETHRRVISHDIEISRWDNDGGSVRGTLV